MSSTKSSSHLLDTIFNIANNTQVVPSFVTDIREGASSREYRAAIEILLTIIRQANADLIKISKISGPPSKGRRLYGIDQLNPNAVVYVELPNGVWDGPLTRERYMERAKDREYQSLRYEVYDS